MSAEGGEGVLRRILVLTSRYPPAHPDTIIPIATLTLALPKTLPATVGIVAKKPPLAAPLMITNAISGPNEVETGQSTNILTADVTRARKSEFNGPIKSQSNPEKSRPTADEKLKPATRPAPELGARRREDAYNGRKKGGTFSLSKQ
jgi:hypothetical protein